MSSPNPAFELQTVAHLLQPWGQHVSNLEQLRDGLAKAPDEVIFHHAVQYQLRTPGAEELAHDDLSAWVRGVVQDTETAERLSFAVQSRSGSIGAMREELVAVLAAVPEKRRAARAISEGSELVFLAARSVSYPTGHSVADAQEAIEALVGDDCGVWFFHLIEEPWMRGVTPLMDWLQQIGEARVATWLSAAANSGLPIGKARAQLLRRWRRSQIARRLSEGSAATEFERREVGRQAIARLVRRRPSPGDAS
jgi:hypothetical protein